MVSLQPFGDLPQINFAADGELNELSTWPAYVDRDHGVPRSGFRLAEAFGSEAMLNTNPAQALSSMQRFLNGPERPPISASLFEIDSTRTPRLPRPFLYNPQYEPRTPWPYPEENTRHGSPDEYRSSSSVSSSNTSYYNYHHDELKPGHLSPPCSSNSPDYRPGEPTYYHSFQTYHLDDPTGGSCTLREIQQVPSPAEEPENPMDFEDCGGAKIDYAYCEQESIHYHGRMDAGSQRYSHEHDDDMNDTIHVRDAESVQPADVKTEDPDDEDYEPGTKGSKRRRRSSQCSAGSRSPNKRPSNTRKRSNTSTSNDSRRGARKTKSTGSPNSNNRNDAVRPFPCPLAGYSCQATFASKNEWKRHVSTQHIRLGFWRCDLCPSSVDGGLTVSYNDFNRKDLFAQHLRRMHSATPSPHQQQKAAASLSKDTINNNNVTVTEENMAEIQEACYRKLRDPPPRSSCLFCPRSFDGPGSWHDRMEHVGRHLEKDRKAAGSNVATATGANGVSRWREDEALREWLCREGLVARDAKGKWVIGDGQPKREGGGGGGIVAVKDEIIDDEVVVGGDGDDE